MNVALVHYHSRGGGVNRVLQAQYEALLAKGIDAERFKAIKLTGETIPELDYASASTSLTSEELEKRLRSQVKKMWADEETLWVIHNPTLAKVPALLGVCHRLAAQGERLLLQIHDFPEDARPGDLKRASLLGLYPRGPHVHFAVVNQRDAQLLRQAGCPEDRVHWLPNPVSRPELQPLSSAQAASFNVLYPTRAIERKNIGEFLLLAALSPANWHWHVSQAPTQSPWLPLYESWKKLASDLALRVSFQSGFIDAQALVTTSRQEGFGYVFGESLALAKPLLGRDLPDITTDWGKARFPHLYRELLLPDGRDFAWQSTAEQVAVIREIVAQPEGLLARHLRVQLLWSSAEALQVGPSDLGPFSPHESAQRFLQTVKKVATSPPKEAQINAARLEEAFLIRELRHRCQPLPQARSSELSGTQTRAKDLPQVIFFDIYGTLVQQGQATEPPPLELSEFVASEHERLRAQGVAFPEVDLCRLWSRHRCMIHEAAGRPWPMPGAVEMLFRCKEREIALGIISNAQLSTRWLFPALFRGSLEELGFDPALCFFSYEWEQAKPGEFLYRKATETLQRKGWKPQEAWMIGNCGKNDILPALALGMRAVFFAGDKDAVRHSEMVNSSVPRLGHWDDFATGG